MKRDGKPPLKANLCTVEWEAHPAGNIRYTAIDLAKPGRTLYPIDYFVDTTKPSKVVQLTDLFPDGEILRALTADALITKALKDRVGDPPRKLSALLPPILEPIVGNTDNGCHEISGDLLTRFAFHHVIQTISQPSAFLGLAFSRDGRTLYASGGNEDVIYRYAWRDKQASLAGALEDDAQDGPDHVDSHRSVLLVISAYNRGGVIHRFVNTTDALATIEEILGLDKLSQFDFFGHPLREIFNSKPDLPPYVALKPEQPLNELNPANGPTAKASLELNLDQVDAADEDAFNRTLWSLIKGLQPYPGTKRTSSLEIVRAY